MLRVSVGRLRPGMVVRRAVFDLWGIAVAEEGDTLGPDQIARLRESGIGEVLIEDARVADVVVAPLFPPHLEARAIQAVRTLVEGRDASDFSAWELVNVKSVVNQLVQRLFPAPLGELDVTGCLSPDAYPYVHPVVAAEMALLIGRNAGLGPNDLVRLGLAAVLMDVGDLALAAAAKQARGEPPDPRRHADESARLLSGASLDAETIEAIRQHHERWDGSGYPGKLARSQISPFAQILAIGDTYHALLSRLPGQRPLQPYEAVEFLIASSGELFDPELTQFFAREIPPYPAGLPVHLNTGEFAIVSNPNRGHVARPIVRVCSEGGRLVQPYDLDLARVENMRKLIDKVLT